MTRTRPPRSPTSATVGDQLISAAEAELVAVGQASISLRAVARRAGVSHAAPKHHFSDRAGLLTAVAVRGYDALAADLRAAVPAGASARAELVCLGQAYVDFGFAHPALFDLMFRPSELHPADPSLRRAQREAIQVLEDAVRRAGADQPSSAVPQPLSPVLPAAATLVSWALVHGLVVLAGNRALTTEDVPLDAAAQAALARNLVAAFTDLALPPDASRAEDPPRGRAPVRPRPRG